MLRAFAGLILIVLALAAACNALTVVPTNCWVGVHGEYRLLATDGSVPGAAAVEEAARIIHARISRIGLADFEVRTRSDGVIEIDLPRMVDPTEVREVVRPTGNLAFVPIPEGVAVEVGDQVPADLPPLFGREGIQQVRPGTDAFGQSSLLIELTTAAAVIFADHTRRSVGHQFAIVLDGVVVTAPTINEPLQGEAQISGIDESVANRLTAIQSLPPLPGRLEELSFADVDPPPGCTSSS